MDDLTLDALNLAALESYDRAAEAGPGPELYDDDPPIDDEPPFGSFPEERHPDHDYLRGTPYAQALRELDANEPGPDYFDAYTVEEES